MPERLVVEKFDRRVHERHLAERVYTQAELDEYMNNLPDADEKSAPFEFNQDEELAKKADIRQARESRAAEAAAKAEREAHEQRRSLLDDGEEEED